MSQQIVFKNARMVLPNEVVHGSLAVTRGRIESFDQTSTGSVGAVIDVEGIIVKSGCLINWEEVRADLAILLDLTDDTTALGRLDEMLARFSTP